jgi:hypothetical protein
VKITELATGKTHLDGLTQRDRTREAARVLARREGRALVVDYGDGCRELLRPDGRIELATAHAPCPRCGGPVGWDDYAPYCNDVCRYRSLAEARGVAEPAPLAPEPDPWTLDRILATRSPRSDASLLGEFTSPEEREEMRQELEIRRDTRGLTPREEELLLVLGGAPSPTPAPVRAFEVAARRRGERTTTVATPALPSMSRALHVVAALTALPAYVELVIRDAEGGCRLRLQRAEDGEWV